MNVVVTTREGMSPRHLAQLPTIAGSVRALP